MAGMTEYAALIARLRDAAAVNNAIVPPSLYGDAADALEAAEQTADYLRREVERLQNGITTKCDALAFARVLDGPPMSYLDISRSFRVLLDPTYQEPEPA
jgi:hypothetical protein